MHRQDASNSAAFPCPVVKKTTIDNDIIIGSLSIVGVGFVKIPPQFYEKGPFYV